MHLFLLFSKDPNLFQTKSLRSFGSATLFRHLYTKRQCFGSGFEWLLFDLGWLDPMKVKEIMFEVLYVFFEGLKASPVAWTSFIEA
jgi:hypothetical protein